MKPRSGRNPRCIIIAGPNGAGKTTFAREFLPRDAGIVHFFLHIRHGLLKFFHSFTKTLHEFRNFFGTEKYQYKYSNEQDFLETNPT